MLPPIRPRPTMPSCKEFIVSKFFGGLRMQTQANASATAAASVRRPTATSGPR